MQKIFLFVLALICHSTFGQVDNDELIFRSVRGQIVDHLGKPIPGQSIIIKHTDIGTVSDWGGNFCLVLPTGIDIFIENSCCFTPIFRAIRPDDKFIKIVVGHRKQEKRNKSAYKLWKKSKEELSTLLPSLYASNEYTEIKESICR